MHPAGNGHSSVFLIWWTLLALAGLIGLALIVAFLPAGLLAITVVLIAIVIIYLLYALRATGRSEGYRE